MGIIGRAAAIFCIFLVAAASISGLAGDAEARANIEDYLDKGPNDFYPGGHDVNGSPVKQVIDVLGWNATSVIGNVGIGNGSLAFYNRTGRMSDVDYPESGFMCGEISTQPWVPGATDTPDQSENRTSGDTMPESGEKNGTGSVNGGNQTPADRQPMAGQGGYFKDLHEAPGTAGQSPSEKEDKPGTQAHDNTTEESAGGTAQNGTEAENRTYAAYHPLQIGKPVKDLLYEHPLATPGTAYCELVGFRTPAGALVNVGMKCTCYGY